MPWAKLDDRFLTNPKVRSAGRDGLHLHIGAIVYAAGELTDGFIPETSLDLIASTVFVDKFRAAAEVLVNVGLWEMCESGWRIHDYLEYNPSRERILGEREAAKGRMQAVRANKPRSSGEVRLPRTRTQSPKKDSPSESRKKSVELTAEQRDRLRDRWTAQTFQVHEFEDIVGEALGHVASKKWTDVEAGVRGWLRREAKRDGRTMPGDVPAASKSTNGLAPSFDLSTEEGLKASSDYMRGRR